MVPLLLLILALSASAAGMNDIEFSRPGGEPLTLDAFVPEGKGPFPAVIIVHGGGWEAGTKRTYVTPWFEPLSKAGFAWFSINYRLAPEHRFPAPAEDVFAAIRWVKAHAAEYKVDRRRIALMGESAGGHLVSYAAVKADKATRVAAVVSFYGPHDLEKRSRDMGEIGRNVRQLLGLEEGLNETSLARLREASPVTFVRKGLPPFLLIHGTKDAAVPYNQSPLMCDRLIAAGNRCEVFTVEGAPHGVGGWEKVAEYQAYKQKMVEWLRSALR